MSVRWTESQLDRLDLRADGRAVVIDYKFSSAQKARLANGKLLQAPLYVLAEERQFGVEPEAMCYVGVRAGIECAQREEPRDICRVEMGAAISFAVEVA